MGISEEEIERSIQAMIDIPTPDAWTDFAVTGIDLMPQIDPMQVPDTGEPPYFAPNAIQTDWIPSVGPDGYLSQPTPDPLGSVKTNQPHYDPQGSNIGHTYNIINPPYEGDQTNWLAMSSKLNSEPVMSGIESFVSSLDIPPWQYPIEQSQIMIPPNTTGILPSDGYPLHEIEEPDLARYQFHGTTCDLCRPYNGKMFDLNDVVHRPVLPSEGLGWTTQHPNCQCTWHRQVKTTKKISTFTKKQQANSTKIKKDIGRKAKKHELHTVFPDGHLSQRTRGSNPIQEAIAEIRQEFQWLSDDYLIHAKQIANENEGMLYLIRAAEESITDHRAEGEQYRRLLSGEELSMMARTAINKGMDINHEPAYRTDATVLDSEYDPNTSQIQMIVMERNPEINQAILNNQITAVSINGGSPRTETIQPCVNGCVDNTCELCSVPRGVVLGELDDIAMTWVATQPFMYNGIMVPPATPGIKVTAIQPI